MLQLHLPGANESIPFLKGCFCFVFVFNVKCHITHISMIYKMYNYKNFHYRDSARLGIANRDNMVQVNGRAWHPASAQLPIHVPSHGTSTGLFGSVWNLYNTKIWWPMMAHLSGAIIRSISVTTDECSMLSHRKSGSVSRVKIWQGCVRLWLNKHLPTWHVLLHELWSCPWSALFYLWSLCCQWLGHDP